MPCWRRSKPAVASEPGIWNGTLESWPTAKIASRPGAYGARSGRAEEGDFAFAGHRDAGQFGGRVGMGKTAPDRATGRITIFSARFTDAPRVRL